MANITVDTITPATTDNKNLDTGVSATGATGGATDITVQASLNGISIGQNAATIKGANWSCVLAGEFSPPGTLTVTASDDTGKVNSGEKSIEV